LLVKSLEILSAAGYTPVNIDASVHLEAPKLGRLKQEMATVIANTLKIPIHFVNIKAKTGEGMDAVGHGDAVEAIAIAQVRSTRETSMPHN